MSKYKYGDRVKFLVNTYPGNEGELIEGRIIGAWGALYEIMDDKHIKHDVVITEIRGPA